MPNLILTGFMGTGKTTVGRLLAAKLNRPFVDMDDVIIERAGCSIPEIFAAQGETGFRQIESQVCRDLSTQDGLVIATGGGALVNTTSRKIMAETGVLICLTATAENLVERLQDTDRPLLQAPDPAQRIRELIQARATAYDAMPHHIDTSDQSPQQTMEAVLALWQQQTT